MRKSSVFILSVLGLVCLHGLSMADERLNLLKNISAAGAPTLTLKMLDQAQPKVDVDLYEWILWEQERLAILSQWRQWDDLLVRIEGLPTDIPAQFKQQATSYKSRAYLELGQSLTARKILREALWQSDAGSSAEYETWRRQVIESYLVDDRTEDARIAMLRFDQDFSGSDLQWQLLRARVLIESGRHEQAVLILKDFDHWQAKLIILLAQYRLGQVDHGELWKYVNKRNKDAGLEADERASLWSLGYIAAQQMSPVDRVLALESLFRVETRSPLDLFHVPADALWDAYFEYAALVGNRSELLTGDDEKWLELASQGSKVTPVKSRSLFAMLMVQASDRGLADKAAAGYLLTFAEFDEAELNLLENLFNRSRTFASANKIPPGIRYRLVDIALEAADIEEATRLMSGLTTIPEGTSQLSWQLRQSRVLILGGRYDEGNQVLQNLILAYKEPNQDATDRILQVLFDLQTVNLHAEAIAHFTQLLNLELEPKQRREILYWIADSYSGLEKYDQAALLYLQSAMLPGAESMDPWAQTARYNAAENLQNSGHIDDARRIYKALLDITPDPARRSLLNHNIQQLWLKQSNQ